MANEKNLSTLKYLLDLIREWIEKHKVGSLTINFFKGGVSSVKMEETVKLDVEEKKSRG